jgi:glycosyltransferase involved in cell wall biosynthesis
MNKIIKKDTAKKVLMIGVYYKHNAAGGMASVIQYYEKYFENLRYIPSWRDKHAILKIIYTIKAFLITSIYLIFDHRIRVVHIHSAADKSFIRKSIFVKLSRLFGKKTILHIHGSRFKDFYEESDNKANIVKTLQAANRLVVLSHSWKEWFINIGIKEHNIIVLNNIVDHPNIKHCEYEPILKLLFLGEIGKRKGVFDVIDVLGENREYYKDKIILKIGGNKEVEKLLKKLEFYKINDFVEYEGWVSGDKKSELLNWADIFILPSFNEGLPIAILEAMSYGKPIISSPVGGIAEIVKKDQNGILVEPGNREEINEAINFFLKNNNFIKEYGFKSKEIVEPFFPGPVLESLLSIYEQLLYE